MEDEYPTYHATLRRSWGNISYPYSQTLVHPHTSNHKKLVSAFYLKLPHNNSGDLVGVDWTDAMFATYKDQRRIEQSKFKKLLEEQSNPLEYKLKHGNQCSERILENYEQDKYYFKVREGDLIIHDSKLPHGGTAITTNDSKVCLIMTFDLIPK